MTIERRTLMTAAITAAAGAVLASPAAACSLTATRSARRFSDRECRMAVETFVRMLNEAPTMDPAKLEAWVEDQSITIDDALYSGEGRPTDMMDFFRSYLSASGKPDARPIRLEELEPIQQRRDRASYAFTLRRMMYYPADPEGCNGMFVHDEFWGDTRIGLIASFVDNRMSHVRPFPEWFAERGGA